MDEGKLSFVVNSQCLGVAFQGLQGLSLYVAASLNLDGGFLHMRYVGCSEGLLHFLRNSLCMDWMLVYQYLD